MYCHKYHLFNFKRTHLWIMPYLGVIINSLEVKLAYIQITIYSFVIFVKIFDLLCKKWLTIVEKPTFLLPLLFLRFSNAVRILIFCVVVLSKELRRRKCSILGEPNLNSFTFIMLTKNIRVSCNRGLDTQKFGFPSPSTITFLPCRLLFPLNTLCTIMLAAYWCRFNTELDALMWYDFFLSKSWW